MPVGGQGRRGRGSCMIDGGAVIRGRREEMTPHNLIYPPLPPSPYPLPPPVSTKPPNPSPSITPPLLPPFPHLP